MGKRRKLVLGFMFVPLIAFALKVRIGEELNVRAHNRLSYSVGEAERAQTGSLKSGSTVEIPDRFVVRDRQGKVSPRLTLNYWISSQDGNGYSLESMKELIAGKAKITCTGKLKLTIISLSKSSDAASRFTLFGSTR